MDARHCAGGEMSELMAYGASVGSRMAKEKSGAIGFIGCATDHTAPFFGREKGMGTMPHALIGYAGSTVDAARLYHDTFPDEPLTVLVDYFGQEITDALAVARAFPDLARRPPRNQADTHGGAMPKVLMCRNPMLCWNAMLLMPFAATVMMRN